MMIPNHAEKLTEIMVKRWRASEFGDGFPSAPSSPATAEAEEEEDRVIPYESSEFEGDLQKLLDLCFPFCCLPGIQIFSPRKRGETNYGSEMDHLLHLRMGGTDYLVVIEAKMQSVEAAEKHWWVNYESGPKDCRKQVDRQVRTLWEYLRPIATKTDLKIIAVVASVDPAVVRSEATGHLNSPLVLVSLAGLLEYLTEFFNLKGDPSRQAGMLLRVSQSPFLSLLRLSSPLPSLGHPEVRSAIAYVERCRRSLDESIFSDFTPTEGHWAINGSAGMGKSVLLAYAAAVFCSGYRLDEFQGEVFPVKANDVFKKTGFRNDEKLAIGILAMSAKQLKNLRHWFEFFVGCFQDRDQSGKIRFRKPEFVLVRTLDELTRRKWSALLVDECHDIPAAAERTLVEYHKQEGFMLVVACDRHQKLRYAADDARILNGLDFGRRTRRLNQNYRNPTPVNLASLALMFRWFADGGHKVIPTKEQLEAQFGFTVEGERASGYRLSIQTDAHPANAWAHTVASFPDAASAYRHLVDAHLGHEDVLWVRFSDEDVDFNYEELGRNFVYHVCRSRDAHKISDKYIKGQDCPVVVIEGFPGFMDRVSTPDEEEKMWSFRRELYLCASRATCFLYFVVNVRETPEAVRIRKEIQSLVGSLSVPVNRGQGGTKRWEFVVTPPEVVRSMEVFKDQMAELAESEVVAAVEIEQPSPAAEASPLVGNETLQILPASQEPESEPWDLWVHGPITVNEYAAEIGVQPFQVQERLRSMGEIADANTLVGIKALEELTAGYGGTLRVYQQEPEIDEATAVAFESVDEGGDFAELDEWLSRESRPDEVITEVPARPAEAQGESLADVVRKRLDAKKGDPKRVVSSSSSQNGASKASFWLGRRAFVHAGTWIEDSHQGIGRILELNTRPGYADSHRVWFAKSGAVLSNHPLRGRVVRIIPESRIPEGILLRCPNAADQ